MAGRNAHPWFYAAKNAWYVKDGKKKIAPGVKGAENKEEAIKAWDRLCASPTPKPSAKSSEALTVAVILTAFLADAESRVKPTTMEFYRRFLLPFSDKHGKLSADALTPALHSRAVLVYLEPSPLEIHKNVGTWFADQESVHWIDEHLGEEGHQQLLLVWYAEALRSSGVHPQA